MSKESFFKQTVGPQVLLLITLFILGFANTASPGDQTPLVNPSTQPEPRSPLHDPYAEINLHELAEIESQGPGVRVSFSHLRPLPFANISGCLTLKQSESGSYSYLREYDEDKVLWNMGSMTPGREHLMVQQIEVGEETEVSFSEWGERPQEECFPLSAPSIVRVVGRIVLCGIEIIAENDGDEKLTFAFSATQGLVHLRGTGRVILNDGTELVLGEGVNPQSKTDKVKVDQQIQEFNVERSDTSAGLGAPGVQEHPNEETVEDNLKGEKSTNTLRGLPHSGRITFYTLAGKQVAEVEYNTDDGTYTIDHRLLKEGDYFYRLSDSSSGETKLGRITVRF